MEGPEKDLNALLRSQGELIGSIAHDLKGLINGIEGGMYFVDSGMDLFDFLFNDIGFTGGDY